MQKMYAVHSLQHYAYTFLPGGNALTVTQHFNGLQQSCEALCMEHGLDYFIKGAFLGSKCLQWRARVGVTILVNF